MASGAIDGIFSGLNTSEIINSIIEAEKAKQNVYPARQAEYIRKLTGWQIINSYHLAFKTRAEVLSRASLRHKISVSSSNPKIISATGVGQIPAGDGDNENIAGLKPKVTLTPDLPVSGPEGKIKLTKGIDALLSE